MPLSTQLEKLCYSQLNVLLKHIRLGNKHLNKFLNRYQLLTLLTLGSLTSSQIKNAKIDTTEKSGTFAIILNTIVTSVFGAWMGFAGFLNISVASSTILLVLAIFTAVISGVIGYCSFELARKKDREAMCQLKLKNIELQLLLLLIRNRDNKITHLLTLINKKFYSISNLSDNEINSKSFEFDYLKPWLIKINQFIDKKIKQTSSLLFDKIYYKQLILLKKRLNKLVNAKIKSHSSSFYSYSNISNTDDTKEKASDSAIKILTNPHLEHTKEPIKKSWIRNNILSIAVSLMPTVLGCFASMFVFLAGGPNLAKEFGNASLFVLLTQPLSRGIEFTIALLLTFFYGFATLHTQRKSFLRDREINKLQEEIGHQEAKLIDLTAKITLLKNILNHLQQINVILTMANTLKQSLKEYALEPASSSGIK